MKNETPNTMLTMPQIAALKPSAQQAWLAGDFKVLAAMYWTYVKKSTAYQKPDMPAVAVAHDNLVKAKYRFKWCMIVLLVLAFLASVCIGFATKSMRTGIIAFAGGVLCIAAYAMMNPPGDSAEKDYLRVFDDTASRLKNLLGHKRLDDYSISVLVPKLRSIGKNIAKRVILLELDSPQADRLYDDLNALQAALTFAKSDPTVDVGDLDFLAEARRLRTEMVA